MIESLVDFLSEVLLVIKERAKKKGVSTVAYLQNLRDGYIFKQILTDLVENVATIKQVEYLNLGVQLSGFGFDVIEG